MAVKKYDQTGSKLLYVDPNPIDSMPALEDMCISVELKTYSRDRSALKKNKNSNIELMSEESNNTTITFVSPIGENKDKNLNTNYTNIHTSITKEGIETQSLGITSIDISFDTSYTPQVTINFTDVRGSSLFEAMSYYQDGGRDKKPAYSCFYELPYPIFELKIKGFYGKPVTYQLHLLDFKSKFNSQTGNFDFTCKFVGYTFAFLSDMLLGYISGIVYTEEGRKIFEGLSNNERYKLDGMSPNGKMPTLVEFKNMCESLNTKLENSSNNTSPAEVQLNYDDNINNIKLIRESINEYLKVVGGGFYTYNPSNKQSTTILSKVLKFDKEKNDYVNEGDNYPVDFNTLYLKNKDNANSPMSKAKKIMDDVTNIMNKDKVSLSHQISKFEYYLWGGGVTNKTIDNGIDGNTLNMGDSTSIQLKNGENIAYIFDIKPLLDILDSSALIYKDKKEIESNKAEQELELLIERMFGFKLSIKNVFKIFLAHAETFMSSLVKLSDEIKTESVNRANMVNGLGDSQKVNQLPDSPSNNLFAFPAYTVEKDGSYVDEWIGNERAFHKDGVSQLSEVNYINKLLDAWIKIDNINSSEDGSTGEGGSQTNSLSWIPILPLDLPQFNGDKHPYSEIMSLNVGEDELYKYIFSRIMLISNFNLDRDGDQINLQNATHKLRAKFEAYNISYLINDNKLIDKLLANLDLLKNKYSKGGAYTSSEVKLLSGKPTYGIQTGKYLRLDKDKNELIAKSGNIFVSDDEIAMNSNFMLMERDAFQTYENVTLGNAYTEILKGDQDNVYTNALFGEGNTSNLKTLSVALIPSKDVVSKVKSDQDVFSTIFNGNNDIKKKQEETVNLIVGQSSSDTEDNVFYEELLDTGLVDNYFCLGIPFKTDYLVKPPKYHKDSRYNKLFFLNEEYLKIGTKEERALALLSSLQFDIDVDKFINMYTLNNGSIKEIPKLYLLLIGAECYFDKGRKEDSKIKKFKTEERFKSISFRNKLIEYFRDWVNPSKEPDLKLTNSKDLNSNPLLSFLYFENILSGDLLKNDYDSDGVIIPKEKWGDYIQKLENSIIDSVSNFGFKEGKNKGDENIFYYASESLSKTYLNALSKTVILINNSTYLVDGFGFYTEVKFNMPENRLNLYLDMIKTELNKLKDEKSKDNLAKRISECVLKSDETKLNTYISLKSITEKWIGNHEEMNQKWIGCGENESDFTKNLIDRFQFIDRSYNLIGDRLLVKPINVGMAITENPNQSVVDVLSTILTQNKMNFLAMPSFFNYRNVNDLADAFGVYSFNEADSMNRYGSSFVCMYSGDGSKLLDMGKDTDFKNDGFDIEVINNGDSESVVCGALDFQSSGDGFIPAFGVNYGVQNQNMFSGLELSQDQFSESDESLHNTNDIAKNGAKKSTFIGQNLFNVWTTRSYEATVESMGNAQIQPLMYFQLNYVPMFHGVYLIKSVTHSIKPNFMTTKFKGQRMRRWATPLVSTSTMNSDFYVDSSTGEAVYVSDSGNSEDSHSLSDVSKLERAKLYLDNLQKKSPKTREIFKGLYEKRKNKSASDMTWDNFVSVVSEICTPEWVNTEVDFMLNTFMVESSFDRFTAPPGGSALGYNQILYGTLKDMLSLSNRKVWEKLGKIELYDELSGHVARLNKDPKLTGKEKNAIIFKEVLKSRQKDVIYLTGIYFRIGMKYRKMSGFKTPIALYMININQVAAANINKSNNNDYVIFRRGTSDFAANESLSDGGDYITPNSIAYKWSKNPGLKPILNI